jgi:hypothetical protein
VARRDEGVLGDPLQFSIVLDVLRGAPATAESLLSIVRRLPEGRSAGDRDRTRQPADHRDRPRARWERANRDRGHADASTGRPAASNAELVQRLVGIARPGLPSGRCPGGAGAAVPLSADAPPPARASLGAVPSCHEFLKDLP